MCIFITKTILSQHFSLKTNANFNKTQENDMKNMFSVQKRLFLAPQARKNGVFKGFLRKIWSFFRCPGIYMKSDSKDMTLEQKITENCE